jgi:hypothetical protein
MLSRKTDSLDPRKLDRIAALEKDARKWGKKIKVKGKLTEKKRAQIEQVVKRQKEMMIVEEKLSMEKDVLNERSKRLTLKRKRSDLETEEKIKRQRIENPFAEETEKNMKRYGYGTMAVIRLNTTEMSDIHNFIFWEIIYNCVEYAVNKINQKILLFATITLMINPGSKWARSQHTNLREWTHTDKKGVVRPQLDRLAQAAHVSTGKRYLCSKIADNIFSFLKVNVFSFGKDVKEWITPRMRLRRCLFQSHRLTWDVCELIAEYASDVPQGEEGCLMWVRKLKDDQKIYFQKAAYLKMLRPRVLVQRIKGKKITSENPVQQSCCSYHRF